MDFSHEFGTVELILNSTFETRGVDAFSLSRIKVEKQLRKIFTYLIFQHPNYTIYDIEKLKEILAKNRNLYFQNFIKGINLIYPQKLCNLYGPAYDEDYSFLNKYINARNKIFHGQITTEGLSRQDLILAVDRMKKWSSEISNIFKKEINFDGFKRNSYRKNERFILLKNEDDFSDFEKYELFLKNL